MHKKLFCKNILNYNKKIREDKNANKKDAALRKGRVGALKVQKIGSKMFLKRASDSCS